MTIETYNKATKILEEIKKLELSIKAYNKVLNSENEKLVIRTFKRYKKEAEGAVEMYRKEFCEL